MGWLAEKFRVRVTMCVLKSRAKSISLELLTKALDFDLEDEFDAEEFFLSTVELLDSGQVDVAASLRKIAANEDLH